MLIRDAQMHALGRHRVQAFLAELRAHVQRYFPDDARMLGKPGVDAVLDLGMARAADHGLELAGHVAHYISLMFFLGSYFDEDLQLPWAGAALRNGGSADERLGVVQQRASAHLRAVAGPKGDRYKRALAAARRAPFSTYHAKTLDEASVRVALDTVHEEKSALLADLSGFVALAREKAAQHGLPTSGDGALVVCVLMLLLGAHFDRDPIHAWSNEVLGSQRESGDKARALHGAALVRLGEYFRPSEGS